ncbi:SNF-related serine/threonine-protein kinase [Merluccius polli]|uniref:non-specific serine/threonine protein kinase n=1 Tax=Merluccius polli TaxID=89951 RepID=A0AA47MP53_MERPO|nr:SNF-related serine/threonine-protein kinase [Merluccius polli]
MLVCGQPPFQEANDSETLTMIMDCKYTVPAHVSNACEDLIDHMLQRDPKGRASLDEIEGHAWLQGVDPSPATKYNTPLVSHKNLSEEEHNSIIQRMVLGDIADREAIVEALETNKYNHITATYYLLAERILREKQEKEVPTRSSSPSNINKAQFRQSWPSRVDMHQDIEDSLASSSMSHAGGPQSPARSAENLLNGHRASKPLELGRREELTVTDSAQGACAVSSAPASSSGSHRAPATLAPKQRTCLFRVEEDEEEEDEQDSAPLPAQVVLRRKPPSITNRLTSRKSAPVLNQIFEEEGESDDDPDTDEGLPPKLSRLKMHLAGIPATAVTSTTATTSTSPAAVTSPTAGGGGSGSGTASSPPGSTHKRYHRRKSQGRGSSCSSSETSDDDSESHRRRLDKDSGFSYSWNRRDSSEGPPGSSGGNGGGPGGGGGGSGGGSGSSSGQGKPPSEGNGSSGPDPGSPPGGGGGGGGKGQGSPSSCCNNNSSSGGGGGGTATNPTPVVHGSSRPSRASSRGTELVESLKLMSLCLSSQLQQHRGGRAGRGGGGGGGGGGRYIIEPRGSGKIQERSSWKLCVGSNGSLDTITLPTAVPPPPRATHAQRKTAAAGGGGTRDRHHGLKNGVLQLPLCEKTISVNIQRGAGSRDGLLCTAVAPPSCCQVI